MPIVAFVNQKGGVGKTTSTVNVATALAAYHNQRVLLIDLDQQAQACISFGYAAGTVADVRLGHLLERVEEGDQRELPFAQALLEVTVPNLSLLPGQKTIERYFDQTKNDRHLLKRLIQRISPFDWVLLDCPPALNLITQNAIVAADWAIVPCEQSVYSLAGFTDFLTALDRLLPPEGRNPNDFYRILPTKVHGADKNSAEYLIKELSPYRDRLFFNSVDGHQHVFVIRRNDALNQAAASQNAIFYFDSQSRGAQDYSRLTELIIEYEATRTQNVGASAPAAIPS